MLDIRLVREAPEKVRENLRHRGMPEKISELDRLLRLDADWRKQQTEGDHLRKRRNEITQSIAAARKKGQDVSALLKEAEAIPQQIREIEARVDNYKQQADQILLNLPN